MPDPNQTEQNQTQTNQDKSTAKEETASADQINADSDEQQKLRRAYLLQQQRMRCPGCGEGDETF